MKDFSSTIGITDAWRNPDTDLVALAADTLKNQSYLYHQLLDEFVCEFLEWVQPVTKTGLPIKRRKPVQQVTRCVKISKSDVMAAIQALPQN